eukprot:scaffold8751_cov30-Tisochrysis_lutea.AAC.1
MFHLPRVSKDSAGFPPTWPASRLSLSLNLQSQSINLRGNKSKTMSNVDMTSPSPPPLYPLSRERLRGESESARPAWPRDT